MRMPDQRGKVRSPEGRSAATGAMATGRSGGAGSALAVIAQRLTAEAGLPTGRPPGHAGAPCPPTAIPRGKAGLLVAYANGDAGAARAVGGGPDAPGLWPGAAHAGDRAEAEEVAQEALVRLWRAAPRCGRARRGSRPGFTASSPIWPPTACARAGPPAHPRPRWMHWPTRRPRRPPGCSRWRAPGRWRMRWRNCRTVRPRPWRSGIWKNLANPEIAAIMDIGVEAVESLVARGKRALTAILQGRKRQNWVRG